RVARNRLRRGGARAAARRAGAGPHALRRLMQSFTGVLVVAAVAFGVDLALGLVPRLPVPAVALEIVAGIVLGPSVLGWAHADAAVVLLALVGLAFLLL